MELQKQRKLTNEKGIQRTTNPLPRLGEGPHVAAAFMANLSSTSGTNGATTSHINEVHNDYNQIFDNVNHLLAHEMHQEDHLDSDVESDIDDNTIPYHQYQLDSEVQDVPTEVSSVSPGEISMITILDDLRNQLDGHLKVNQEQSMVNDSLRTELSRCKLGIQTLERNKVKHDLDMTIVQRNKWNVELEQENVLLKSNLSQKVESIKSLKTKSKKGSFVKQALETELTRLKDAITSVRIQNDGFKLTALTAENAKLKSESLSKMHSELIVPEKPKVLAPRIPKFSKWQNQEKITCKSRRSEIKMKLSKSSNSSSKDQDHVSKIGLLEPCYNQTFGDNTYPHDSLGVTLLIDHHCCYKCGDSLDGFFCHQCTCEFCGNGAHDGYNCPVQVSFIQTLPSFPQQYPCCEDFRVPHETFQCQPMNYFESNPCYNSNYFGFDQIEPPRYSVNPSLNIQNELSQHKLFINVLIQQKLQNEYAQPFPAIAITFDLPTVEPEDSLRMEDEHLDTILETKSDKFIKSSVENLVPSPSESKDDNECDVPTCDDFTTFSNLLFDADDDFSSSDNGSFSDEDILKEIYSNPLFDEEIISMKIDPHHFNAESDLIESLLNHDSSIISSSSKIDSLLDEFAGELILLKSIPPGIDETDCDHEVEIRLIKKLLYDNSSPRLLEEFISENYDAKIISFSPFPIPVKDSDYLMEEINLSFTLDDSIPPDIEEDDYDSEVDMLILEELLSNDSLSLPKNKSFYFDIPSSSRPPAKPSDDDPKTLSIKMVDDISELYVPMPRLLPTQPTFASNKEKSPHLLSHRGLKASHLHSESQMMIYEGTLLSWMFHFSIFIPLDQLKYGRIGSS
nr:hypothetical protein [Tanacetum cinerariifolium]